MNLDQAALVARLRGLLADEPSTREVFMFGGRSFMVDERLVVGALRDGDLLVRVSRTRDSALIEIPGASRAEMGAGRSMGPGWISVRADSITSDDRLSFWLDAAMEHHRCDGRGDS